MYETVMFFLAGGALGCASAYLHGRQPSTLGLLAGLYAIALAVCFIVGHATRIEILAFLAPYVVLVIAASLSSAGLAIYGAQLVSVVTERARTSRTQAA